MIQRLTFCVLVLLLALTACEDSESPQQLSLLSAYAGTMELSMTATGSIDIPVSASFLLSFSAPLDESTLSAIELKNDGNTAAATVSLQDNNSILLDPNDPLLSNADYDILVGTALRGKNGEVFSGGQISFKTTIGQLNVISWSIGGVSTPSSPIQNVPLTIDLEIRVTQPIAQQSVGASSVSVTGPGSVSLKSELLEGGYVLKISTNSPLRDFSKYKLTISNAIKGVRDEAFTGFIIDFYTGESEQVDFPLISDEELLTKVQQQTFKYFLDFAHPSSGMARERNTSGDVVTSGGSGFGIMSLIVGIERNFITRADGVARMEKILDFLENADRFHGAWSHWINGSTGKVVPFSANDNGGDLVETSFLVQGLITMRQYLDASQPGEAALIDRINTLWQTVEWDWYRRDGQNVLYWHWSPDKAWAMNHQIKGYNEALITYVLAASSPTHTISPAVYQQGWASNGTMANGKTFYNTTLPLGFDFGGPLFFTHYSFLGIDPRQLQDQYANYWTQNRNHSLINHAHSIANPQNYVGYSDENWGLTASDNHIGYSAHSPTNDLGVISPTAALSSFPYTPEESMKALKFFYYHLGDRLWGNYGFYDAFNLTAGWTASSYLAIDQGPIIIMIENYRTGLLWDLFMSAPEVQAGLTKLNFTY